MDLQSYLVRSFCQWQPPPPEVVGRSKHDVTLSWEHPELAFLAGQLLYRVERKEKLPPWVLEYCGSRTTRRIDNLAPCCPHKFRIRFIIKAESVPHLARKAVEFFGSEEIAYEKLKNGIFKETDVDPFENKVGESGDTNLLRENDEGEGCKTMNERGDKFDSKENILDKRTQKDPEKKWLESQWSDVQYTSTESAGTSAVCFCMAVRGGYTKQVQSMLEERPELVGIINNTNGYTPLATAVREGDLSMVKLLVGAGAELEQLSTSGQTPLQLAVLGARADIFDWLLQQGADFQACDKNGMRVEHFAVDSCSVEMLRAVLDSGGDVTVRDTNAWTPLFRAIIQGSPPAMVEELLERGSDVTITDRAGLTLLTAARLLTDRHGRPRHSILRLVDEQYPREKAVANFTRLTKKISSVHSLLKPASPTKKT